MRTGLSALIRSAILCRSPGRTMLLVKPLPAHGLMPMRALSSAAGGGRRSRPSSVTRAAPAPAAPPVQDEVPDGPPPPPSPSPPTPASASVARNRAASASVVFESAPPFPALPARLIPVHQHVMDQLQPPQRSADGTAAPVIAEPAASSPVWGALREFRTYSAHAPTSAWNQVLWALAAAGYRQLMHTLMDEWAALHAAQALQPTQPLQHAPHSTTDLTLAAVEKPEAKLKPEPEPEPELVLGEPNAVTYDLLVLHPFA
jgi:hypothetical protein